MRKFFKLITRVFKLFVKIVWFCFMFLIVYGIARENIDKFIEKFRKKKKKQEMDEELFHLLKDV